MQVANTTRRLSRVLRALLHLHPDQSLLYNVGNFHDVQNSSQWRNQRSFYSQIFNLSGTTCRIRAPLIPNDQYLGHHLMCSMMARYSYFSEASTTGGGPTEAVRELYEKMLKSIEAKTMPPDAWLWSLIESCTNQEDITLLFQILQILRKFRLSNLRIHANFNCNICLRVAEACAAVGALDFGKKALLEHNVYGLTPSVGSAHYMLLYAKEHNDAKLMVEIMKLMRRSHLPLQPGTADIIFRICYNTDNWELISEYSKKFLKAGVKLHRTTFDTWMEFAAKQGDVESIWEVEKLRSDSMKQHTLISGFSCAKGFLLVRKPESAAAIVHNLSQNLPDMMRSGIKIQLQKLVSEWPLEIIKRQKEEDRKAIATSLKDDISAMIHGLLNMGSEMIVNMDDLTTRESIPC